MTTTIRTCEPRDLIALVPYRLGFRPAESAVVLSLRGPRGRVGMIARVDLEALIGVESGEAVAESLVDAVVRDGAHRAVLVVYADHDARGRAAEALATFLPAARPLLGDVECWVVEPSGWYALGCADERCCPEGGRPHSDLESAPVSAAMVLSGVAVERDREALGSVGEVPAAQRRSARRAADRWSARRAVLGGRLDDERWRADGLALWRRCLERLELGVEPAEEVVRSTTVGRLRAALDDVLVRDAVLVTLVPAHAGEDDLPRRVVARDASAGLDAALRALTDPALGLAPGEARSAAATTVLRAVAAHAGPEGHAPSLTLLAVLAWWGGDGARAAVLLERALRARPGYRLAMIVREAVGCGLPPGWLAPAASGS